MLFRNCNSTKRLLIRDAFIPIVATIFPVVVSTENEGPYYTPTEVVAKPLLISRGTRPRLKIDLVPECLNLNTQFLNTAE